MGKLAHLCTHEEFGYKCRSGYCINWATSKGHSALLPEIQVFLHKMLMNKLLAKTIKVTG